MTTSAPTSGLDINLTTDFAGVGGSAKYVRVSPDIAYYFRSNMYSASRPGY